MNTAIIVAAGSGSRFNSDTPKQFCDLHGKPILFHSIERFDECDAVESIIVVLAEGQAERFAELAEVFPIRKLRHVIKGGTTRSESVLNGLQAVDPDTKIVAVHDGARPLVSVEEISLTMAKADEIGAACVVAPITDTVKEIDGDRIVKTVDRRRLRRALTPQAFRLEILLKAFENADLGESVTDECFLVEKLGFPIGFVPGSTRNIKITQTDDLAIAEMFLKNSTLN